MQKPAEGIHATQIIFFLVVVIALFALLLFSNPAAQNTGAQPQKALKAINLGRLSALKGNTTSPRLPQQAPYSQHTFGRGFHFSK